MNSYENNLLLDPNSKFFIFICKIARKKRISKGIMDLKDYLKFLIRKMSDGFITYFV